MPWTNKKKRKSSIQKKSVSKHTLRFRETTGPIITVRSLASVGGAARRAMNKYKGSGYNLPLGRVTGVLPSIVAGFQRAASFARDILSRPTMQSATQRKAAQRATNG